MYAERNDVTLPAQLEGHTQTVKLYGANKVSAVVHTKTAIW